MAIDYANIGGFNRKATARVPTPQTQPIRGRESEMAKNDAGGYGFALDDFGRLYRFMILGTEGGTFYVKQNEFTRRNLDVVKRAIDADPRRAVDLAVSILRDGRAFKQDPALFVLALCASYKVADKTDVEAGEVRKYALDQAMGVIRQSTQLFHFMKFVQEMRGWGSGLRKAFARWYVDMPEDKLALQVTKYKNRDGVTHRDMLRLAHPKWTPVAKARGKEFARAAILQYAARPDQSLFANAESRQNMLETRKTLKNTDALKQIAAAEELLHITGTSRGEVVRAVNLITEYGLTHEMVAPELKNSAEVWAALAQHMPVIATLRNLGKMTQVGAITRLSETEKVVAERLTNAELIGRSRAHPIQFLIAARQYAAGKGAKGSLTWTPMGRIIDAIDAAFPLAFGNVEPSGKRILVACDYSGSMTRRDTVMGMEGWSAAELAGAMAYIHLRTEPNAILAQYATTAAFSDRVTSRSSILDALTAFTRHTIGAGTDTAAPYRLLMQTRTNVDAVISYTDNNTWAGQGHSSQANREYARLIGHPVRFVNCATEANGTTDVDPSNPNMLEIAGFDAAAPKAISDFIGGRF